MNPRFSVGQVVCLKADPSRTGAITELLSGIGGSPRYRVFHTAVQIAEYYEDQIEIVPSIPTASSWADAITQNAPLDVESFRARLTAARLSHPQVDNLYALQAARINFIPFQFKPLLKFLRADQPRLLIADEVGVGKTIEAGLILRELQTRQHLENVLIVCPKALTSKWHKEMRRFDEDFQILTSESLRYCLRETDLDGIWPQQYSRAIVHLELLRVEKYRIGTKGSNAQIGIQQLDPPPSFSLTIVDEAHHLRNPGTSSHAIAQFLCDISEAAIFLSATPLHLGNENLFTLLNLLRPDLFIDKESFQDVLEPNQYLNEAIRQLRYLSDTEWPQKTAEALEKAACTQWGKQILVDDLRFSEWHHRLRSSPMLSHTDRVKCIRSLEEVHTLAHIMNRTRRRDIGKFTIRDPKTVSVAFTVEQQSFYDLLIEFRRQVLLLEHDPRIVRLITDTLERQASSCLPALLPTLEKFLATGRFGLPEISDISDDADLEKLEKDIELTEELTEMAQMLRQKAAELPKEDPKLDRLLDVVQDSLDAEGPGKLLVFSFFLHTLSYLKQHLQEAGYRVALINGKVDDVDRERLRERFRLPRGHKDAIEILLSSEVGCEGLDYEFCDRLVNYDIPWNPMRVEQRIGRIDRYGQKSDKVLIFNFITPGTVEERIFFRCFDRLGLFQDAIGDTEEVLGNIIYELNQIALDTKLSAEQAEAKARQLADNKIRYIEEQRHLEAEHEGILGVEKSFSEDVETLIEEGRFVSAVALCQMVEQFLATSSICGRITNTSVDGVQKLQLAKEGRLALLQIIRSTGKNDRNAAQIIQWLDSNESYWNFTFNQKTALEHREIPFVTPIHPLAKAAIAHFQTESDTLSTSLRTASDMVPPGMYIFTCELWESVAVQAETQMICRAYNLEDCSPSTELASRLLSIFEKETLYPHTLNIDPKRIECAMKELDEAVYRLYQSKIKELKGRNNRLIELKTANLKAHYQKRLDKVANEIKTAKNERIVRMKVSEEARIGNDYSMQLNALEDQRDADIVRDRVAAGILVIEPK